VNETSARKLSTAAVLEVTAVGGGTLVSILRERVGRRRAAVQWKFKRDRDYCIEREEEEQMYFFFIFNKKIP